MTRHGTCLACGKPLQLANAVRADAIVCFACVSKGACPLPLYSEAQRRKWEEEDRRYYDSPEYKRRTATYEAHGDRKVHR